MNRSFSGMRVSSSWCPVVRSTDSSGRLKSYQLAGRSQRDTGRRFKAASPGSHEDLLILDTARQSDDAARVSHLPHDKTTPLCGERRVGSGDRLVERLVAQLK